MNQSPRNRISREDRTGSADLQMYGHYNRIQASSSVPQRGIRAGLLVASLGACIALAACSSTPEPKPAPRPEPVPQQQAPAEKPPVELAERAPERYVVKKGDTLWDISAMFLKDPWLWPEIWYTNPQINNPHLIYPGDVITIFWYDGQAQMRITRDGEIYQTTLPVERLSPKVRVMPLDQAIPTIPIDAIRAFLGSPRIITEDEFESLPYIVRSGDGRLMMGEADRAFIRTTGDGPEISKARYNVIRLGDEYEDPVTGEDLGYEAMEIASGVITSVGDPAIMMITDSNIEAMKGDRLIPAVDDQVRTSFMPHAPADEIEGQIIDVIAGVSNIGQYQIVTLNRGARDGLETGHVLDIYQRGKEIEDDVDGGSVRLPDRQAGTLMLFRVDDRVSYGLVMEAFSEIHVLDIVRNP